eukprot:c20601_g1_i1 orf=488-2332(+)
MQEAMEADQDKSLSRSGSFYAEDSFLLSDYLHRQAEKASNRFFNHTNSLFFLRSRYISSESQQKEEEDNSDRCCPPVLKSMPVSLNTAHKESSESFTGRECSSHILLELEQEKGDSSLPHKTLASSVSYVESSECCESESAAEAATRIEANSESLHNSMLCCEAKQAISLSNEAEEDEDVPEDGVVTEGIDNTEALNLLVIAAMQVDEDVDCDYNVALGSLKRADSPSKADHDAFPVHGNCSIRKKKAICCPGSAIQKQNCDDPLHSLEISEAGTRVFERKRKRAAEHHTTDLEAAQIMHKGLVACTKRRKLRDLCLDTSYALVTECTDVDEHLERKHGEEKNLPNRCFGEFKEEISDIGSETPSKRGSMQVTPSKISSSLGTEGLEIAHRQDGNCRFSVNHRKLQVSSTRLSDACNAEHLKEMHMQGGQPRICLKLENSQTSPTSNKSDLQFVAPIGATKACPASKQKRKSSMEKLESQEAHLRSTPLEDTLKNGSSGLRLKILPIRLPSADLPSLQEVSKSDRTEVILEDRMVTRKRRSSSLVGEHDKANDLSMAASELKLHKADPMADTSVKDGDPVIRTKRGRSQVLPTKFSDSVLQPWKSSRRKGNSSF